MNKMIYKLNKKFRTYQHVQSPFGFQGKFDCLLFEGREGVNGELGFAFFRGWEMGFCALGLRFMKKKKKNGNGISI